MYKVSIKINLGSKMSQFKQKYQVNSIQKLGKYGKGIS